MRKLLVVAWVSLLSLVALPAMAQNTRGPEPKGATPPATPAATATPTTGKAAATTGPASSQVNEVGTLEYLYTKWQAGGATMYFILALSLMGLASVLERMVNLTRGNIAPHGLATTADRLWQAGNYAEIQRLCANNPSILARVIEYIVEHRDSPVSDVSAGASDIASEGLRVHYSRAYYLAIAATVAPLLGLFGTIWGMMGAFEQVSIAGGMGGDPSVLAKDISLALVTTAGGLIVAMPALFLYHIIKMRTASLGSLLGREGSHLIGRWLMKKEASSAR